MTITSAAINLSVLQQGKDKVILSDLKVLFIIFVFLSLSTLNTQSDMYYQGRDILQVEETGQVERLLVGGK